MASVADRTALSRARTRLLSSSGLRSQDGSTELAEVLPSESTFRMALGNTLEKWLLQCFDSLALSADRQAQSLMAYGLIPTRPVLSRTGQCSTFSYEPLWIYRGIPKLCSLEGLG